MWGLGGLAFLALWLVFFFAAALLDEDVNHWEWPTDTGPGLWANVRMLAASGALAALLVGVPMWLVGR